MLKKRSKIILFLLFVVLFIGIFVSIVISCLGVVIRGRSTEYVHDYDEYYLCKKEVSFQGFMTGDSGYKIWFAPGQKEKLLRTIEEELITELEELKKNHSDILKNYEISSDFKNITYYHEGAIGRLFKLKEWDSARTETKVELYHQIIHGSGNTEFHDDILKYVEVK